jgi:hypothetical protein
VARFDNPVQSVYRGGNLKTKLSVYVDVDNKGKAKKEKKKEISRQILNRSTHPNDK